MSSAQFLQASNDVVDVRDSEHDATDAQRVHTLRPLAQPDRLRRVELVQLEPPVTVRGPHHCDVASDAVEPDDAVHPCPSTVVSPSSSRPSSVRTRSQP